MGKLTLRQAAEWCGGVVEEKYADVEFLGAANDTRVMQPGQLFIALQGARDGHDFIKKAMDRGAAAGPSRPAQVAFCGITARSMWTTPALLWEESPGKN